MPGGNAYLVTVLKHTVLASFVLILKVTLQSIQIFVTSKIDMGSQDQALNTILLHIV